MKSRTVRKKIVSKKKDKNEKKEEDPLLNDTFFDKYKTTKKLGQGSFGRVYRAEYKGEYYAIKFENRSVKKKLLRMEGIMMTYLQGEQIPYIKLYGYSGEWNLLIMQLLGKSLENYLNLKKKFSIKTTAMLGYQMIKILQYIHEKHIIHRDVKPDNFAMGINEYNALLYIIDFGLAKKYRSSRTLKQNPMTTNKRLTGTARYASINALEGCEQSRRDDLESVGYVMIYLMKGGLPWQGLKVKSTGNKYQHILDMKKEISSEELCKDFPIEFQEYLDYTRSLEYEEEPDYEMLKLKFITLVKRLKYKFDNVFDWTTKDDIKLRKNKNYEPNLEIEHEKLMKEIQRLKEKRESKEQENDSENDKEETKSKKKSKSKKHHHHHHHHHHKSDDEEEEEEK